MSSDCDVSVLFVCRGNTCRSPMAQQIFTSMVEESGCPRVIKVDSCGTAVFKGSPPSAGTELMLKKHGYPKLSHEARQFEPTADTQFDFILVTEERNMKQLQNLLKGEAVKGQLKLLGSYDPNGQINIADPFMGDEIVFERCFQHIHRCLLNVVHTEICERTNNKNLNR
ncbi:low molecular weight phosphotyrosine protein phosphatase-like [Convolutriloba macropyga]|uniref:low molecular weight phosphotyrosine protein phosphatase-like n=1 Tax=Convolutriloba macropyga TaxID=536237 RepID=UPI003F526272